MKIQRTLIKMQEDLGVIKSHTFNNKIIIADLNQVRRHLIISHDYVELQKTAVKLGIIKSDKEFRGYGWLLYKIADLCVIKELENGF